MSRRHRYSNVSSSWDTPLGIPIQGNAYLTHFGHTPTGVPLGSLSVPYGCIAPYANLPFTLDGGHTWFDQTGKQVVQTVEPRPYVDRFGRVVFVNQPVNVSASQATSQSIPRYYSQSVSQPTPTRYSQSASQPPRYPQAYVQDDFQNGFQETQQHCTIQTPNNNYPVQPTHRSDIVETGKQEFGREEICINGKSIFVPIGRKKYTFNSDRTSVSIEVTSNEGVTWSGEFSI